MEVELAVPVIEDEDDTSYLDHNNDDYSSLEGERCGICMDVVIDRGVLDCCQHWYCFTCIDNWATITNLCPLCQNEFQSITCVPVYDTIGSNNADDDILSREDDWNIEGENNTLSFPSYYIDENAVICLDGDGCKIRNGSVTIEDDPNLDTSIACDSCDIWYHAFCVGFDTEGTCETSWLCPGCIANGRLTLSRGGQHGECLVEATTLSGKVSVSIADAGETAVVVSMVERTEETQGPCETQCIERIQTSEGPIVDLLPISGVDKVPKVEMLDSISSVDFPKLETLLENIRIRTLASQSASSISPCASPEKSEVKTIFPNFPVKEPSGFDCSVITSTDLLGESCSRNEPCGRILSCHPDLSKSPSFSDDTKIDVAGEHSAGNMGKESMSECLLQGVHVAPDRKDNSLVVTGTKRKLRDHGCNVHTYSADEETKNKVATKASKKKVRVDRRSLVIDQKDRADEFTASGSQESIPKREKDGSDIMSIVQGTNRRQRENATGLRVKKIMRRDTKDKESSVLVENLRKEIREAVRIKSELGANQVNPELLAAFRVAVSGSVSESAKNSPALVLKAKKVILQKGKVRENLTKKIYGSGGKRKGGWTRDCEIEFWKHRCLQAGKPEKINTLKSVLNLLRNGADVKEGAQEKATTSILSRLYLADSSVFPRKDDIKPLSDLGTNSAPENVKPSILENLPTSSVGNPILKTQQKSKVSSHCVKSTILKSEIVGKSDNVKTDKRKWALEILARKTAATSSKAVNGIQEDDPVLQKNYPLLAQLPVDMRPALAPSRHKKIPTSVRQAQLYRLIEHFLRKTNLPVIRRTADTELAVADAVNIEKEVADKSNSKLVYTNLMSQQVSHMVENTNFSRSPNLNPTLLATSSERSQDIVEDPSNDPSVEEALKNAGFLSDPSNDPSVEEALKKTGFLSDPSNDPSVKEALKKAGFLSDSPPNSPCHRVIKNLEADESKKETEGEEYDNIIEVGSHPDADIYGDFEYNLEDEDFIGASVIKIRKVQEEEDSKIKVVFSSFASDKLNPEGLEEKTEVIAEGCCQQDPIITAGDVDIQCEELYGPDKEPLVKLIPENEKLGFSGSSTTEKEPKLENKICPGDAIPPVGGEDEPVCSQTSENVPKEDKLADTGTRKHSDSSSSISKKVEAYIKEHIRPLCKSGVITVEQYRWSVEKTTEKVMKYHSKEKNANFLIKEGDKVKKLAEQYVEASQHKKEK